MDDYYLLYEKYKDCSMVPPDTYVRNLVLAELVSPVEGAVVECGVWRGGMIAGIAEILGHDRDYYLVDSFEGLPPAQEIDGASAIAWQQNTQSPLYFDNCAAAIEVAQATMQRAGVPRVHFVRGWFSESLKEFEVKGAIAVLRLDGDWYDSTMDCLNYLYPQVASGGLVLVDDYYVWDGCSRAVHDYFSKHQLATRIQQFDGDVCYFLKP